MSARWTPVEDRILRSSWNAGCTHKQISAALGHKRSVCAIRDRLRRLGHTGATQRTRAHKPRTAVVVSRLEAGESPEGIAKALGMSAHTVREIKRLKLKDLHQ